MSDLTGKGDLPIISFETKEAFYEWMTANHTRHDGVWLRMFKKASAKPTVVWAETVEVCLCFGWIDGVANKYDEESYIQRLTPRRKSSSWSKINRASAERLLEAGLVYPEGLAQIESAKQDGRWDSAYDSPKDMKIPSDFLDRLRSNKKAYENFAKLKKASLYSIGYSLSTAKRPETRERRANVLLEKLENGEAI